MSYALTVLIGLDQLGAAIFFNRNDTTISALAGLALKQEPGVDILGLSQWQMKTLRVIGRALNKTQKDHCTMAIQGDLARAKSTQTILS